MNSLCPLSQEIGAIVRRRSPNDRYCREISIVKRNVNEGCRLTTHRGTRAQLTDLLFKIKDFQCDLAAINNTKRFLRTGITAPITKL